MPCMALKAQPTKFCVSTDSSIDLIQLGQTTESFGPCRFIGHVQLIHSMLLTVKSQLVPLALDGLGLKSKQSLDITEPIKVCRTF